MTTEHTVADAVRTVAMKLEHDVERGCRSQLVTMNELLLILHAIADRIDPPASGDASIDEDPPY